MSTKSNLDEDYLAEALSIVNDSVLGAIANPSRMGYVNTGLIGGSRDSDSWFTPAWLVHSARRSLGGHITLDPATDPEAQRIVRAETWWTKDDDCLVKNWSDSAIGDHPTLWMNPPYAGAGPFVSKFFQEAPAFSRSILLTNSTLDTSYYRTALATCEQPWAAILTKRIKFWNVDGKAASSNTKGQVLFFLAHSWDVAEGMAREFGDTAAEVAPHEWGGTLMRGCGTVWGA